MGITQGTFWLFNERCIKHLTDEELEPFLEQNPPANIVNPVKLDGYMRNYLEKKGAIKPISIDDAWSKIQNKVFQITGPLGKMWEQIQMFFYILVMKFFPLQKWNDITRSK